MNGKTSVKYPTYTDDLKQTVAVLAQATESNERQIREVAQTSAVQFKEISVLIEKTNAQTNVRLESLVENFQASQKPNIMAWIAGMAIVITIITGGMWIISLNTENTVYKNLIPLQSALDSNTARDSVSESDRKKLNEHLEKTDALLANMQTNMQVFGANLKEVETQFRAGDEIRNIQFAETQRSIIRNAKRIVGDYSEPDAPTYFPRVATDGGGNGSVPP